jgi:hypothetical protein
VAWVLAKNIFDHHEPYFAPIAALIALNTSLGERGVNAVRLLQGVIAGILVGETTIELLGGGYGSLALATFVAMAAARILGGNRLIVAQAAVGAILTVASTDAEVGTQRLGDALLGAGVALVFSQLLFSPEPVALLRRAETTALSGMAAGLALTARSLEEDDETAADEAISRLRALRDDLADLGRMRTASARVARRTLVWRSQRAPVVRELENAGHLDLLGVSCLALARAAISAGASEHGRLSAGVGELAEVIGDLAHDPGDRGTRQRAVDRALEIARELAGGAIPPEPILAAAIIAFRAVAVDTMVFAGVDPNEAVAAVLEQTRELEAVPPPPTSRLPFGLARVKSGLAQACSKVRRRRRK